MTPRRAGRANPMNDITIFQNPEFGTVRTLLIDGEPYFVGDCLFRRFESFRQRFGGGVCFYPYAAAVNIDDLHNDGKTEAGAFTGFFCCEKRIENMGKHVFADPRSIVIYSK